MWRTKLVSAVRAAILSVSGRPWRKTDPTICSRTAHISSTAPRMTFMNPPGCLLDLQAVVMIHDDRAVDVQFAVFGHFDVHPVHRARRRAEEVVGVAEIAAAMAGALEAGQDRVLLGRLLTGVGVRRNRGAGQPQVARDR